MSRFANQFRETPALKQGRTKKKRIGVHQRFEVIEGHRLGLDGARNAMQQVVDSYRVKPSRIYGD